MSTVFFTADLHLGHAKVAELRGFPSAEEHDAHLISVWNKTVSRRDVVYVLGDIALSNYDYALDTIKNKLNGTKHLITGNHDIVHPMHKRGQSRQQMTKWLDVFDTIQPFLRKKNNGNEYLLSHFPYTSHGDGDHREGSRYDQYRLPDHGVPLLHGHTHGTERAHGNMLHVGWDAWSEPVNVDHVSAWLDQRAGIQREIDESWNAETKVMPVVEGQAFSSQMASPERLNELEERMRLVKETAERRNIVEQALHSARLSGLEPSDEVKADMELWIKEDISIDEVMERTLRRYKK